MNIVKVWEQNFKITCLLKILEGKQVENLKELYSSEKKKFSIVYDLFQNFMNTTSADSRNNLNEENRNKFLTKKNNCIHKFINSIQNDTENNIEKDFFENEDLIALSFINNDDIDILKNLVNNILTNEDHSKDYRTISLTIRSALLNQY